MTTSASNQSKIKKYTGYLVAAVGFTSSVIGIMVYLHDPVTDNEIKIFSDEEKNIVITSQEDVNKLISPLKADKVSFEASRVVFPDDFMVIANEINIADGSEIAGHKLSLIATQLSGGSIVANSLIEQQHGGSLFLAVALINETVIQANGSNGAKGKARGNGKDGQNGADGRKGRCDGFGRWRASQAGRPGVNGGNGEDGLKGEDGGDAGNIFILTSYQLTVPPIARAGQGGDGGQGGAAGRGGKGGRGGSGCSGLGGSQDGKPNGADGINGIPGKAGFDGTDGVVKEPVVKLIKFAEVKDVVIENLDSQENILMALRQIKPKSE